MTQNVRPTTAEELLTRLRSTPDVYPQKLDLVRESCLVIELGETAYRAASFLDDRILSPATRGGWLPLDRVLDAARLAIDRRPLHFIFHTGHVGSTLVSRLLDETGVVLPLREPLPLRTLADVYDTLDQPESLLAPARFEELLAGQLRLWSRGYAATRCVIVKATSSAARLAPAILSHNGTRAIYLNQRAESAIATLLAGQNSPLDLRGHGPGRMKRLCARIGRPLAAAAQLVVRRARRDELAGRNPLPVRYPCAFCSPGHGRRLRCIPRRCQRRDAARTHAFRTAGGRSAHGAARSQPALTQYSKAPEHAYGPAVRAQVLDGARRQHRDELGRGLAWLASLARSDKTVADVLDAEAG
jgi:hypothetical protein